MTSGEFNPSIIYLTVSAPYGRGEPFCLPEIRQLMKTGVRVAVFPVRPKGETCAPDIPTVGGTQPHALADFIALAVQFRKKPLCVLGLLGKILRHSGSLANLVKNLVVFPRAAHLAHLLAGQQGVHLHAYWASTPATAAYIASKLTGLDWSFTAHRGDIRAANMFGEKIASANFCRAISLQAKQWVDRLARVHDGQGATVMFLGVPHRPSPATKRDCSVKVFAVPANLLPVKGHRYFLDACTLLRQRGYAFKAFCFGNGPLKAALIRKCQALGLIDAVSFPGALNHEDLIQKYQNGEIDVVVLPSIVSRVDEHEGIPVALMEAMSFGIPVIATRTGAIGELVRPGAGLLVEERNVAALADAMCQLADSAALRSHVGVSGYEVVSRDFDLDKNTARFFDATRQYQRQPGDVLEDRQRRFEQATAGSSTGRT